MTKSAPATDGANPLSARTSRRFFVFPCVTLSSKKHQKYIHVKERKRGKTHERTKKTIWLGCDHGGYVLKKILIDYLTENGYKTVDVGCDSEDIVPWDLLENSLRAAFG